MNLNFYLTSHNSINKLKPFVQEISCSVVSSEVKEIAALNKSSYH
jgi:hypothetical protein